MTKYNDPPILKIDPFNPEYEIIKKATYTIEKGGIVIIPTLGLYGIAANAFSAPALKKIYDLKKRPETNPILILIKNSNLLNDLVSDITPAANKLMKAFWPGRITLIFNAKPHLSTMLTADTGKIGIRIPGHPVTAALTQALDFPITGTSANLSGNPGCHDISSLSDSIIKSADLILDAGSLKGGPGSTVIDTTTTPVRILREGAVPKDAIFQSLG